jgi:DNA-binding MarR family transcriptional regulator
MAETLRELVVALSLDSSNFSRNMRSMEAREVVEVLLDNIRDVDT